MVAGDFMHRLDSRSAEAITVLRRYVCYAIDDDGRLAVLEAGRARAITTAALPSWTGGAAVPLASNGVLTVVQLGGALLRVDGAIRASADLERRGAGELPVSADHERRGSRPRRVSADPRLDGRDSAASAPTPTLASAEISARLQRGACATSARRAPSGASRSS